jgi:crotonobetainyl-CoA:carnitine CoA-transferase CaiB-like acyl-CoA transferase
MPDLPLEGIRILDLSRLLPGPYLTQLLADLGAEVIKVETPRLGDYARLAPPEMGMGGMFAAINRGKKSVAINYRNPHGRDIFLKLAATTDVVLEGFKPGSMKKWGIDYEAVRRVKPDIIYCSLSGYGQEGPYRERAGHDLNYLAVGGALALNGRAGEAPVPYGLPAADLSGGMLAAIAILGALVGRGKRETGMYLDMALLDGVISWMTPLAGGAFFSGLGVAAASHPLLGGLPSFNVYEAADGKYLTLGIVEPTFWADFCQRVACPDWIARRYDRELGNEIAALFRQKPRAEWLELFADSEACVEAVNSFEEMLAHPQVRRRGYVREADGQPVGMNSPFVFARDESAPAPRLGEQTETVLTSIGLSDGEIEELAARGVIGLRNNDGMTV